MCSRWCRVRKPLGSPGNQVPYVWHMQWYQSFHGWMMTTREAYRVLRLKAKDRVQAHVACNVGLRSGATRKGKPTVQAPWAFNCKNRGLVHVAGVPFNTQNRATSPIFTYGSSLMSVISSVSR